MLKMLFSIIIYCLKSFIIKNIEKLNFLCCYADVELSITKSGPEHSQFPGIVTSV